MKTTGMLATGIIKEGGRTKTTTVNLEKGPSDVWWSRFKARHPELASQTADSLDRARVHGATPEAFEAFFKLYEALYMKHNLENKPHLIYNCDETVFGDKPRSREKVLCQTGRKHIYQQQQTTREHIMVQCCVKASQVMPIGWMGPPTPSMASRKRAIWTQSSS
ncbi:tigger transposable element-derived 1 [Labeo rohita]|uniref:Tigger transposable element-derived 1 n=1 Tax=Labeo rohita TaxID=84645 RepID=A0A498NYS8_LABRO|nr:tigger transposable element-derived 1 [Labeo rohita]